MKNEISGKIIMCSAISDKKCIIKAIKAGASDYIVKSFDSKRLESALNRAINNVYL